MSELVGMNEFQRHTLATDQNTLLGMDGLRFPLLGLFGEVGSLLSALKKKQRDRASYIGYQDSVIEEFGDVLWYFSNVAARSNLDLSVLAQKMSRALSDWDQTGPHEFGTFGDIQPLGSASNPFSSCVYEQRLIELAGKVGRLLDDVAGNRIEHNRDALAAHLVEIFRALVSAADEAGIDLGEAAARNITKTLSRWPLPEQRIPTPLFDESDDPEEQLPRRIAMDVAERGSDDKRYVRLRCNELNIGDRLTDNKADEDDYRFHDVFHLAYAAILGWSPVTRALFKVKRKSRPKADETQDGARATLVEEGISTWIFSHACQLNYFESITSLDYPLLKTVQAQVKGYEVESCPLWLWEKAILDGYTVFRELRARRKGLVVADLNDRSIVFRPLQ
ncbi:MAG: nucleoside triphosphate pyrophosphohydrolase family protein [Bryobacteraceae bacterium]|nr:nucleoside triphosphate pyrophosphohydrolase family protein [Bryobacteraceae bacterium]